MSRNRTNVILSFSAPAGVDYSNAEGKPINADGKLSVSGDDFIGVITDVLSPTECSAAIRRGYAGSVGIKLKEGLAVKRGDYLKIGVTGAELGTKEDGFARAIGANDGDDFAEAVIL